MIEIKRQSLNKKWDAVTYKLDPPRPWRQLNLNKLLGHPQYQIIQLEINKTYRQKKELT